MTKLTKNSLRELEVRLSDLRDDPDMDDEERASWASTRRRAAVKEISALLADPTHERLSRSPLAYEELEMMSWYSCAVIRRDLNKADNLERERDGWDCAMSIVLDFPTTIAVWEV